MVSTTNCLNCALIPSAVQFDLRREKALPSLSTVNKIWGAVLAFFGQALKVEQADGSVKYVRIEELKNKFLLNGFQELSAGEMKMARKDAIIHDLFLSTINPFKGDPVKQQTLQKINQLAINLKYSSAKPKDTYATLRKIRATIYCRDGMTNDQKQFISAIKLGDILFHRTDDTVHSDIVQFQTIAKKIGFGTKHRDATHHNHAYMCAKIDESGKKWFAEAAWPGEKKDEIRLISEDDVRCFIKQDRGAVSEIFRCHDQTLAKNAAGEACAVTTELAPQAKGSNEKQPTKLRYSIMDGAQALFFSNRFGHMAKVRLIQQIRSTREGKSPVDFIFPKSFFCSSFVGYAYQTAEVRPLVHSLLGEKKGGNFIGNLLSSHIMAYRYGNLLDQKMTFNIDPKRSTPADFYSWLSQNSRMFTSIQSYQQPE